MWYIEFLQTPSFWYLAFCISRQMHRQITCLFCIEHQFLKIKTIVRLIRAESINLKLPPFFVNSHNFKKKRERKKKTESVAFFSGLTLSNFVWNISVSAVKIGAIYIAWQVQVVIPIISLFLFASDEIWLEKTKILQFRKAIVAKFMYIILPTGKAKN